MSADEITHWLSDGEALLKQRRYAEALAAAGQTISRPNPGGGV